MPKIAFLKALFHQATAYGTRSTVLNPLGWLIALLLPATISSFYFKTPTWLGITLATLSFLSVLLYFFSYVYFMFKDSDALRSEKFSLQKLLIEKGFFGDDIQGFISQEDIQLLRESHANSPSESEETQ